MLQVYQEDHLNFRARIEQALGGAEDQIARDNKMLVNKINRTFLSRYPFEDVPQAVGIQPSFRDFSASRGKLDQIRQLTLTLPGTMQKFTGL